MALSASEHRLLVTTGQMCLRLMMDLQELRAMRGLMPNLEGQRLTALLISGIEGLGPEPQEEWDLQVGARVIVTPPEPVPAQKTEVDPVTGLRPSEVIPTGGSLPG